MPTAVEACTHERRWAAADVQDFWGNVVRHIPEICTACGHAFPEEEGTD